MKDFPWLKDSHEWIRERNARHSKEASGNPWYVTFGCQMLGALVFCGVVSVTSIAWLSYHDYTIDIQPPREPGSKTEQMRIEPPTKEFRDHFRERNWTT